MDKPVFVEALGKQHAVVLPDFAAREELAVAFADAHSRGGVTLLRVYSALLGLCTRIGRDAKIDYAAHRFDALAYGGAVYAYLRERGMRPKDISTAAHPIVSVVVSALAPREAEVQEEMGKSAESGAA